MSGYTGKLFLYLVVIYIIFTVVNQKCLSPHVPA